jgi:dihydrolipoamide dehydrogenase
MVGAIAYLMKGDLKLENENLVVLGGGPGGYTAAFLAADQGFKVTLIDADAQLGGVCLNRGCIPSKALLHIAKLLHETRRAKEWGISYAEPEIDLGRLRGWKDSIIKKMSTGLNQLSRQRGVRVIQGRGVFQDSNHIKVSDKETIRFDRCIIATGSRPILPESLLSAKGDRIMDSTTALELDVIPNKMLVVGGGYIGLEMGTIYSALGCDVSIVEKMPRLLTGVDLDLVRILQLRLRKDFSSIYLDTELKSVEVGPDSVKVVMDHDGKLLREEYDRILVAVGRRPNSEALGLSSTTVQVDERGFIKVNAQLQTTDPNIMAIGDVIGGAMLAHKASSEAKAAVENLAGKSYETSVIPAVVFTDPEIAWCGLTEIEANESNINIEIAKFPWGASGRAQTLGRNDGMTKLIIDPVSEKILGVGIVGPGAGDLISEGVLAIQVGVKARDMANTVHPHPTLSETLMESAEVFYGAAPHISPRKK